MARYRLGIDVGGTFTDFVLYDQDDNEMRLAKVGTTPADPSQGVLNGIKKLNIDLADVESAAHGTTTATNTLIERDGAKTAFLTTEGFRDTLEIRRANRKEPLRRPVDPAPRARPPPSSPRDQGAALLERGGRYTVGTRRRSRTSSRP